MRAFEQVLRDQKSEKLPVNKGQNQFFHGKSPTDFGEEPDIISITTEPVLYYAPSPYTVTNVGTASLEFGQVNFSYLEFPTAVPNFRQYLTNRVEVTVNYGPPVKDCESCGDQAGACSAGSGTESLSSIDVVRNLGKDTFGNFNNSLGVKCSVPSAFLSTPNLVFTHTSTNCEALTNGAGVRQIRAPLVLADIVTNTAYKYDIRFYHTNDVSPSKTNGFWVPTTNNAYRVTTIENTNGSTSTNQLFVTDTDLINLVTNQSKYTWDGTNQWTLEPPGGIRKETLSRSWSTNIFAQRTELRSILNPTNLVYTAKSAG